THPAVPQRHSYNTPPTVSWAPRPLVLIEDMMRSNHMFGSKFKYPSFILDYEQQAIQDNLQRFLEVAAIPCGLKEMARKIKQGTLATEAEKEAMEAYRVFRQTHFF
ncbi:MAG: hypothetical protein K2X94_04380, partial [Amoebophilaceae bacterium]|nr:hypothetical protein [Amoebophilaceae bacterium]